jgi:glutamate-1-semialdehyde 2,1-aminomutase
MNLDRSNRLIERFHELIPGGAHTYAKGDDQYPEGLAPIIVEGRGCRVVDVDGNEFVEFGMGLRSVTLGHAHPGVLAAVRDQIDRGSNFTRPALLELEAAEALLELLPNAEMVKFAKNGSDATTAAVRLARAATGRDLVAVCSSQQFLSTDDWFIGTTAMAAGIPERVRALSVTFPFNDVEALETLLSTHRDQVAAVVLEPATATEPTDGYLQAVRRLCDAAGALLILDETITGFRWHLNGAQHVYGVVPDLSIFGKALGNGFPISVLVGRRNVMELGDFRHDRDRVFLLSTTHGAEGVGLAAAKAVMRIYREDAIVDVLYRQGERLVRGIRDVAAAVGVADRFRLLGRACNLVYATLDADGQPSQGFRTLFLQEAIHRGILSPSLVVSAAHDDATIDSVVERFEDILRVYRRALEDGLDHYLVGRPVQPVFQRKGSGGRVRATTRLIADQRIPAASASGSTEDGASTTARSFE